MGRTGSRAEGSGSGSGQHDQVLEIGLYTDPAVYDILHTPGTADEFDGLLRLEEAYVGARARRRWLEPACGTGRYVRMARARGIDAVGFDLNASMIEYAATRARRARSSATETYFVGSMTEFAAHVPGRITFAFNLINTIRHLSSDEEMLAHFEQMRRVMARGAVYCVGISLSMYGFEQPTEDVWQATRGSCRVRQVVQYLPPVTGRAERVISHLSVERPSGVEERTSTYDLRTYSRAEWERLISESGLGVVDVVDPWGEAMPQREIGYMVFVLGA